VRRALLIALLAALLLPTAASAMRNPVVPETAAGDDTPDPWLFRHADRYWLTYTTAGRIELRSARTLTGLAGATPRKLWPPDGVVEPLRRHPHDLARLLIRLRARLLVHRCSLVLGPPGVRHRVPHLTAARRSPRRPRRA